MYEGHPTIFVVQEFGTPSESAAATISEQVLPSEPTQIAVATTRPASAKPQVLGTTQETSPAPTTPSITSHTNTAPVSVPIVAEKVQTPVRYASWLDFFFASPKTTLRYAYYLIGFLILCTFFMITRFEFREHHRRVAFLTLGLLFLMGGLFFIADRAVFGTPTLVNAPITSTS
jgi:hypothetical protein